MNKLSMMTMASMAVAALATACSSKSNSTTSSTAASTSATSTTSSSTGVGGAGGNASTSSASGTGGAGMMLNGCTQSGATDDTGMSVVQLTWSLPHQQCIRIKKGSEVDWSGNFTVHPLSGGPTGMPDAASPITTAAAGTTGQATVKVTFPMAGAFPYFCTVHQSAMQGVIYVQ